MLRNRTLKKNPEILKTFSNVFASVVFFLDKNLNDYEQIPVSERIQTKITSPGVNRESPGSFSNGLEMHCQNFTKQFHKLKRTV